MASPASTVRTAWAADAEAIAAVQARAWRNAYAALLPATLLADLDDTRIAQSWRAALTRPPSGQHHVLVALDGDRVVGFTATAPCEDADAEAVDGEVLVFHVEPGATRRGHGSRLLAALADTLHADGFVRAYVWLFAADDPQRQFFASAGWAPDGAHRELDLYGDGSVVSRQIRLHTALADAADVAASPAPEQA